MKNKILMGVALAAVSASASALTLPDNEFVRFNFAGVDDGTVGYPRQAGALPADVCSTGAECDVASAGQAGPGFNANSQNGVLLNTPEGPVLEDTWGVGSVQGITGANGSPSYFSQGDGGEFISLFFYGLYDATVTHDSTNASNEATFSTFSLGGFLDVYSDTEDFAIGGSGGRTSLTTYDADNNAATDNSPTDGELLLRLAFTQFNTGGSSPDRTLGGTFNDSQIGGGSTAFFDVVGGSLATTFDTNGVPVTGSVPGQLADFSLNVSFQCPDALPGQDPSCDLTNTDPDLFTVLINGSFLGRTAEAVPTPASLLLMLAGAGVMLRKRKQS